MMFLVIFTPTLFLENHQICLDLHLIFQMGGSIQPPTTPQKSNIDTKNDHILKGVPGVTFSSRPIILGPSSPLVFFHLFRPGCFQK